MKKKFDIHLTRFLKNESKLNKKREVILNKFMSMFGLVELTNPSDELLSNLAMHNDELEFGWYSVYVFNLIDGKMFRLPNIIMEVSEEHSSYILNLNDNYEYINKDDFERIFIGKYDITYKSLLKRK